MSAIAGCLAPRPAAVPATVLDALGAGLAARGPDGCTTTRCGRVGMVHRSFHTTRRSPLEFQPRRTADGVVLAWDGRLDAGAGDGADTAWRLLAAYRRWGEDFADRLLGDFAVALWDPGPERLILARDPFSDRCLFYGSDRRGRFLWASNLTALHHAGDFDTALDDDWISGFLLCMNPEGRTPFRALAALPPGHVLVRDGSGTRLRRTWPGDSLGEVRCRDDREYEERFRDLLRRAVRHHLEASGPVFLELSGGVDSSSIACLADDLLRRGEASAPDLRTCSFVFRDAPDADEREHLARVERLLGRRGLHVDDRDAPILEDFDQPWTEVPTVIGPFRRRYLAVAAEMRRAGARVMLNGLGGDEVGMSQVSVPPHLVDLAARGRLPTLLREMGRWRPETGLSYLELAWRGVVLPLLPASVQSRFGPPRTRPPWLGRALTPRPGPAHPWRAALPGAAEAHLPRPSMRQRCAALRATVRQVIDTRYLDVEVLGRANRYPFLYRPLVELCLGLPLDQMVRHGETRSLHRRALAGVLPPEIARRRSKSGPDEAMMRALERQWPRLQATFGGDARIYDAGFVERRPFLAALDLARCGLLHRGGPVFQAIELETWLRAPVPARCPSPLPAIPVPAASDDR